MPVDSDIPAEHSASDEERARLGLLAGEMVYRIRCVRLIGDQLLDETRRLPAAAFPGLLAKSPVANITVLAKDYGLTLGDAVEGLAVDVASDDIAKALKVPKRAIVLKLDRIVYLKDGRPVEWRTTYTVDHGWLERFCSLGCGPA